MYRRTPKNKYGNVKIEWDGHQFDSIAEAERYLILKDMMKHHEIKDLGLQPEFELQPAFEHDGHKYRAIKYIADFIYTDVKTGQVIVEDKKGFRTELYKIKKKLLLYKYPDIDFREV